MEEGYFFIENCNLNLIKSAYKKGVDCGKWPNKNNIYTWINIIEASLKNKDFEVVKFFVDICPEVVIKNFDKSSDLFWSETPFADKEFSWLDENLHRFSNEQAKYFLLEKFPNYIISAGTLYRFIELCSSKDNNKLADIVFSKFNDWELFFSKCVANKDFLFKIKLQDFMPKMAKCALEKGIDLYDVARKNGFNVNPS